MTWKKDSIPLRSRLSLTHWKEQESNRVEERELGGTIMTEFVLLRPKLYSYKKLDGSEDKKCKGIKKCIVKKTLTFEDYKNCLLEDSTEYRSQLMF